MSLIVQKYRGSSISDAVKINNVAQRIIDTYKQGHSVVVVVSAQGTTTDELIEKAKEINSNPSKREMDVLISTGEQISSALLAMAIQKKGYNAISFTGSQAGINTDSNYGTAKILDICSKRIFHELEKKNIAIVAGFQGWNKNGDITTLGRGGSDTTAVALAVVMKADLCEIYTDISGIYTAEPRSVKNARRLQEISFDEMLELAILGTKDVHSRALELAKKYKLNLLVKSSSGELEGTIVREVTNVEKVHVKRVTQDNDVAEVFLVGLQNKPDTLFRLFSMLAKEGIVIDMVLQSIETDGTRDISFTVSKSSLPKVLNVINSNLDILRAKGVKHSEDYSKISIVGASITNNPAIVADMFEALFSANINIHMFATSELRVSALVDIENSEKAVNVLHNKFEMYEASNPVRY